MLILVFTAPMLVKTSIFISWKANQDYIIENCCINRDKPELECNGKCQLSKQLKAVDQEASSNKPAAVPKLKLETLEMVLTTQEAFNHQLSGLIASIPVFAQSEYTYNYLSDCFHPPQV